jgi:hypothetical protein
MRRTGWVGAAAMSAALFLVACGDDDGKDDLAATCELMGGISGPEDVTVEKLDKVLETAPEAIEEDVSLIRARVDRDGDAAYEDEEVGAAFERVGAFEADEC